MFKLYQKDEVWFAVAWIAVYCIVSIPIRGELGDASPIMLAALALIAAALTVFIRVHGLAGKYGLAAWPEGSRRYLYFIPVWILVTGNLWGGAASAYPALGQVCAVASMLLIGYIEEVVFRGFLFKGILGQSGLKPALIISAVTFGIGHIVNLLAGQASLETLVQVIFAIAWGFIFTCVFYRSGSLWPCILAHGLVNSLAMFGAGNPVTDWIYMGATILVAALYCPYLLRLKDKAQS